MKKHVSYSNQPVMTSAACIDTLRILSPESVAELRATYSQAELEDRRTVFDFLENNFPSEYVALVMIERVWQSAHDQAYEQQDGLLKVFLAERKKKEGEAPKAKKGSKERKRDRGTSRSREKVFDHENTQPSAIDVESPKKAKQEKNVPFEPWCDAFNPADFRLFNSAHGDVSFLRNYDVYKRIYHCSSSWEMERLHEDLTEQDHHAVMVKAFKVPADLDMLRWKVITSEN